MVEAKSLENYQWVTDTEQIPHFEVLKLYIFQNSFVNLNILDKY